MPTKLNSSLQNLIAAKNISTGVSVEIFDFNNQSISQTLFKDKLTEYSYSLSKKFSASSATLILNNQDGRFSPDNADAILKEGFTVSIKEYFADYPSIKFERFYGIIKQINPAKSAADISVEVTCYDPLIKLQETDIEKVFESTQKELVENEVLAANPLPAPREYLSQVFDGAYSAWAAIPPASISVVEKNSNFVASTQTDGFEVFHNQGQVSLNKAINIEDYDVKATYFYYKQGLFAEDILQGILLEPDDTGNPLFTADNVCSSLLIEEGTSQDHLIPYNKPLNLTAKLERKLLSSDSELYINRADSWKFITSHQLKVGDDQLGWNGKEDVVIGGVALTKLKNITGTHPEAIKRGAPLSVFYNSSDASVSQVWRTTYNNMTTGINASDFTIPGANFETFDSRTGLLLLNTKIPITSAVTLNKNYSFVTIQSTGIEIPYLRLSRKKHPNRLEAIKREIMALLPPNYVLLSRGTDKIWGLYLTQKPDGSEDYQLELNQKFQYVADQETYTRVYLLGKNNNPHNIMLDESTKVLSLDEYDIPVEGLATNQPLRLPERFIGVDIHGGYIPFCIYRMKRNDYFWDFNNMQIYSQWLENGVLRTPTLKIDDTPVANEILRKTRVPVVVKDKKIHLPHSMVIPPKNNETSLIFYDQNGEILETGEGYQYIITKTNTDKLNVNAFEIILADVWYPEGRRIATWKQLEDDSVMEDWILSDWFLNTIGFVSYSVILPESINNKPSYYYSNGYFYIQRQLLSMQTTDDVSQIPEGADYADTSYTTPRYIVIADRFSNISSELTNINLKSGDNVSFDKSQLGENFSCRLLRIIAEHIEPIEYARRVFAYPISIASFNVYEDVEFESTARLSPTTKLTQGVTIGATTLYVEDTGLFPNNGTAYLGTDDFNYTGKASDRFTGVTGISESHLANAFVTEENVYGGNAPFILDPCNLLKQLGDKVYKESGTDQKLTSIESLNNKAKAMLSEFYKNHRQIKVDNLFAPYVYIGQTARIRDPYQAFEINRNYFVESVNCRNGEYSLELGFYP